ncbi:hypothetical protein [Spongiactinospora sp. TRM90649]|uniref:hypothetical protein n=1 Tax=Spongiactinospora sp. TRM90649 TaxID=3031114 RepID=UPI0023F9D1C1|nr:hypothetical protein [Spongiactinospora sp. TRM90649]MDF5753481.1 hypothetical protein [Spongiactinospora sp. TRM90649]
MRVLSTASDRTGHYVRRVPPARAPRVAGHEVGQRHRRRAEEMCDSIAGAPTAVPTATPTDEDFDELLADR